MSDTVAVDLPTGTVAVPVIVDAAPDPRTVIVLAHGAGAGPDHPFLAGFASAAASAGHDVVRFPFPYVVAGRRMPGPAAHAIAAWRAVIDAVSARADGLPVVAAGKSYGGRMASMAAAAGEISPQALAYLGYPLHPPGRPDRPRVAHLPEIPIPQLFLSGTRDAFVQPWADLEDAVASCRDAELVPVAGGGHSFEVAATRRSAAELGSDAADAVTAWVTRRLAP
ncbi:alpha/beta hydrolase family protein [Microbacterium radiodurans]|uniref:Dienelactone hydrolase n=1 Tax=Microbacterium radiodurans TaxID=661398 RepID=A0A5J5IQH8_9MICO|nr:alpha/beta family hydrolase [Microbacterium radiodurans]KAA9086685.1 dienelactone hydrolase [Microbacterium radiodurans]